MRLSIKLGLITVAIASVVFLSTHDYLETKTFSAQTFEENKLNQSPIISPYEKTDPSQLPPAVPMTDEQRLYATEIAKMTIRVIAKQVTLEKAEATLFGSGEYNVSKDASKPILGKSFRASNFRMQSVSLNFGRKTEQSVWSGAGVEIEPPNFPQSAYQMDLPTSFFEGMVKDKAFLDERPEGNNPRRVHVFQFHTALQGVNVKLQFETREDMSNLNDSYPKSFHYLKVTRQE